MQPPNVNGESNLAVSTVSDFPLTLEKNKKTQENKEKKNIFSNV